ncbi:hypothetical protein Glove_744g11 [Diversispora epigaea]|uniref:Uncharacterized protein n=1 Tax=Diversispora epigaea TaxID=1348612 RepID=A0A397FZR1_9GLOM|nr:hypothetical protein Glove_744g11 [Diversispora epigaea]
MSSQKYLPQLLAVRNVIPALHYGPFAINWCIPIRVGMRIQIILNKTQFIIHTICDKSNIMQPSYIIESDSNGQVYLSASEAINKAYKKVFNVETRFSGLSVMGFDNENILEQLLSGVLFQPFKIQVDYLSIFISNLDVFCKNEKIASYNDISPIEVWKKTGILKKYSDETLFGINHSNTIDSIKKNTRPMSANIDWYKFFVQWKEQPSSIIEFRIHLGLIYPSDHQLTERELSAWRTMIKSVGGTNITPFKKEESTAEFWTRSPEIFNDQKILSYLYTYTVDQFWKSLDNSIEINKRGLNGKQRILSIIVNNFSFGEIYNNLKFFVQWKEQPSSIIEFRIHLGLIYPSDHQLTERELSAWRTMIKSVGGTNITPFKKEESTAEFWTRSPEIFNDQKILSYLYTYTVDQFWKSLDNSIEINKRGLNGKQRILSIIVNNFSFGEIYNNLKRELSAWRTMIKSVGGTNITPFKKEESTAEFWTRSPEIFNDQKILSYLYTYTVDQFWKSLDNSIEINKRGLNGKQRILSIIVNNFSFGEIYNNLKVSNDLICAAQMYFRINGSGCPAINKPIIKRNYISEIKNNEFEIFFSDKNNVSISSYRVDPKTNLPLLYLKDNKQSLWEKFEAIYPDGIKRTSFMTRLTNGRYVYRQDLGGLCSICNEYGYEVFDNLINTVNLYIEENQEKNNLINAIENLRHYLRRGYEKEIIIKNDGTAIYDNCINHCLLYAFNKCTQEHEFRCPTCDQLFLLIQRLTTVLPSNIYSTIEEKKDKLNYFLAHQARKVYSNSQFKAQLSKLDNNGAIFVCDYKMRILPKSARETKEQFFGKRGWTLHTILVYTKKDNSLLDVQAMIIALIIVYYMHLINVHKSTNSDVQPHQARKVYSNSQFKAQLSKLDNNGAIFVCDYKMRILPKSARETKEQFFGKRGWTLHTILVYTKKDNSLLDVQAYDHWFTDTKQDAWFTASSFDAVFEILDLKPKWIKIFSDNGGHYHNSELITTVTYWNQWYNIDVRGWYFFEPGKAKSSVDSHHAQITHAIKRYIRIGNSLDDGKKIETAINNLGGTAIVNIEPKHNHIAVKTISGITKLSCFEWPIEGQFAGYIRARSLPNLGPWLNFSPEDITRLISEPLHKPNPEVSTYTKSNSA